MGSANEKSSGEAAVYKKLKIKCNCNDTFIETLRSIFPDVNLTNENNRCEINTSDKYVCINYNKKSTEENTSAAVSTASILINPTNKTTGGGNATKVTISWHSEAGEVKVEKKKLVINCYCISDFVSSLKDDESLPTQMSENGDELDIKAILLTVEKQSTHKRAVLSTNAEHDNTSRLHHVVVSEEEPGKDAVCPENKDKSYDGNSIPDCRHRNTPNGLIDNSVKADGGNNLRIILPASTKYDDSSFEKIKSSDNASTSQNSEGYIIDMAQKKSSIEHAVITICIENNVISVLFSDKKGSTPEQKASVKDKKVQILDIVRTNASKKFANALKGKLATFDCTILKKTDDLDQKTPLIVICVKLTRLKPDVDLALENVEYASQYVVVIAHIGRVSTPSNMELSERFKENNITFIDMTFDVEGNIYECEHNLEGIKNLTEHIFTLENCKHLPLSTTV